ncbi:hypothetical protein ACHAWF_015646 [Thalassiosira exigua]
MQAINVFRRNVFSSSAGKICQSLHPAETTIPGSFSRRMATSGSLLAEIFNRNKDEGKRICEAVDGNYLNERIFQSKELRRKHIEKMRRMDPHDKIVERYDSWTAAYESKEKELIEECGGDIPDKPAIERWAMALYLKFIETKDVGAYVLKETPDENGVPCNDEDIASLITKARNIAYVRNVGGGKGEHWAKEHVLRVGLPESGNELLRCIYYPFFDVSKGDAGAFLAELWVINLLYHILGGTGKLLNQSLNGVGPVKDPDGKKNHRFGILLIENFQENLGNGVAGINGGLVAHTLEQFKENIPGEVPILEVVTAKQKQPKKLYVVREGGEYGKIIMAYVGIAKLRLGLGGRSNELTEADIGTEGKFHRSLFFVEPYAKEVHGPFDDIAVDEGRVKELKAKRESKYAAREGGKYGKEIMTYDRITKLHLEIGGGTSKLGVANIGTEGQLHRGMHIEPYDEEVHGPFDWTFVADDVLGFNPSRARFASSSSFFFRASSSSRAASSCASFFSFAFRSFCLARCRRFFSRSLAFLASRSSSRPSGLPEHFAHLVRTREGVGGTAAGVDRARIGAAADQQGVEEGGGGGIAGSGCGVEGGEAIWPAGSVDVVVQRGRLFGVVFLRRVAFFRLLYESQ